MWWVFLTRCHFVLLGWVGVQPVSGVAVMSSIVRTDLCAFVHVILGHALNVFSEMLCWYLVTHTHRVVSPSLHVRTHCRFNNRNISSGRVDLILSFWCFLFPTYSTKLFFWCHFFYLGMLAFCYWISRILVSSDTVFIYESRICRHIALIYPVQFVHLLEVLWEEYIAVIAFSVKTWIGIIISTVTYLHI